VVRHMRHANAVWWDVGNTNCRITKNVFADVLTVGAAIHMEMTPDQNQIDNNIIWDVRNAEPGTPGQRGCAGSGIFDNATDPAYTITAGACPGGVAFTECIQLDAAPTKPDPKVGTLSLTSAGVKSCSGTEKDSNPKLCWP